MECNRHVSIHSCISSAVACICDQSQRWSCITISSLHPRRCQPWFIFKRLQQVTLPNTQNNRQCWRACPSPQKERISWRSQCLFQLLEQFAMITFQSHQKSRIAQVVSLGYLRMFIFGMRSMKVSKQLTFLIHAYAKTKLA